MYSNLSDPLKMLTTPKPSFLVQRGKTAREACLSLVSGASVFLVAGLWYVFHKFISNYCAFLWWIKFVTVEFKPIPPPPVAERLISTPLRRRFGRYLETTTVISSSCWLITQTQGGIPFKVRARAPAIPLDDINPVAALIKMDSP